MHRVTSLEQDLADARARVGHLEHSLVQANAEIARLRGNEIAMPAPPTSHVPAANLWIVRVSAALAGVGLIPLFAATYKSESLGMAVAQLSIPLWGALLAAFLTRRRPTAVCIVAAIAGGLLALACLVLFFATIWRSL